MIYFMINIIKTVQWISVKNYYFFQPYKLIIYHSHSVYNESNCSNQPIPSSVLYTGEQLRDSTENLTTETMTVWDEFESCANGILLSNSLDSFVPPSLVIKSKFRESKSCNRNMPFE